MKNSIKEINKKIKSLIDEIDSFNTNNRDDKLIKSYYKSSLLSVISFSDNVFLTDPKSDSDENTIILENDPIILVDGDDKGNGDNEIVLDYDPIPSSQQDDKNEIQDEASIEADIKEAENDPNVILLDEDPELSSDNEIVMKSDPEL